MRFLRVKFDSLIQRGHVIINSIHLPDRFKGTVVEKWARYWESLLRDYSDVARETVQECRKKPRKALFYVATAAFAGAAAKRNPSGMTFRDHVINYKNEFGLVGEPIRRPEAERYLEYLEGLFNRDVVRTVSLGVVTIVWRDDFSEDLALYRARCEYLKPRYVTWHERVLDVGFWGSFWVLDRKMKDFDVNLNEWE